MSGVLERAEHARGHSADEFNTPPEVNETLCSLINETMTYIKSFILVAGQQVGTPTPQPTSAESANRPTGELNDGIDHDAAL